MVTEKAVPVGGGLRGEAEVEVQLHGALVELGVSGQHCQVASLEREQKWWSPACVRV